MATMAVSSTPLFTERARLEVTQVEKQRVVHLNGHQVACYACEDRGTERVIATQLAEALPIKDMDIARSFGMHPVSLSRFKAQAREAGAAALMPKRLGPKGPSKLTAQLERQIRELAGQELSCRAIAKRLCRGKRKISYGLVASVLKREQSQAQAPLAMELPAAKVEASERKELVSVGERRHSRYAGALMLFASLTKLDLFGILESLGASSGPSRRLGWKQAVSALVFCFALRFRSVEDSKNALREDLGVILGERRSPSVQSLRKKVCALAESVDPVTLSRKLFRSYVKLEPVWEGLYYIDGHFCPYYGQHATPKGWDAKRHLAAKGHTDTYVHDARGRVLFFLSQPLNSSLARAIPSLVEEIRQVHGQGPFTLVFDRGGYSGKVFRYLKQQGIGFLTYLKGRKAGRRYPVKEFQTSWFSLDNQRHTYRVYEKKTRVTDAGMVRTIVFIGNDAKQIPVLTNLDASFQPAKVIHCLKLRWRQENSFKYLSEHYGIEQFIQYGGRRGKRSPKSAEPEKKGFETEAASSESGSRTTRGRTGTCSGPKRGDQTSNSSRVEDRPQSPSTSPGKEAASPDSASQPFATYARSHRRNRCRQDTFAAARRPSSGSQRHQARRLQLRETSCASLQRILRTAQGRLQRLPGTIAVARRRSTPVAESHQSRTPAARLQQGRHSFGSFDA